MRALLIVILVLGLLVVTAGTLLAIHVNGGSPRTVPATLSAVSTPTVIPTYSATQTPSPTRTPSPTPTPAPTPVRVNLADAINNGYITAHIRGTGSSTGDCIESTFDLHVNFKIELYVERGTYLTTGGTAQEMAIMRLKGVVTGEDTYIPESVITLEPGMSSSSTYLFEAYCIEFHKENPSSFTTFAVQGSVSDKVRSILNCGAEAYSSINAVQVAIWSVTDDVSKSELDSRFPVSSSALQTARQLLECAGIDPSTRQFFQ